MGAGRASGAEGRAAATVKDASGNVVELKNLRPDGTIGEPVEALEETTDAAESDEA